MPGRRRKAQRRRALVAATEDCDLTRWDFCTAGSSDGSPLGCVAPLGSTVAEWSFCIPPPDRWVRASEAKCDHLVRVAQLLKAHGLLSLADTSKVQAQHLRGLRVAMGPPGLSALPPDHPLLVVDSLGVDGGPGDVAPSAAPVGAKLAVLHAKDVDLLQGDTAASLRDLGALFHQTRVHHVTATSVAKTRKWLLAARTRAGKRHFVLVHHGELKTVSPIPAPGRGGAELELVVARDVLSAVAERGVVVWVLSCTEPGIYRKYLDDRLPDRRFVTVVIGTRRAGRGGGLFLPQALQAVSRMAGKMMREQLESPAAAMRVLAETAELAELRVLVDDPRGVVSEADSSEASPSSSSSSLLPQRGNATAEVGSNKRSKEPSAAENSSAQIAGTGPHEPDLPPPKRQRLSPGDDSVQGAVVKQEGSGRRVPRYGAVVCAVPLPKVRRLRVPQAQAWGVHSPAV